MEQVGRGQLPSLANYQLRLPAYEGPLDVLLRLIERSRLAIEDVSLVAVTDQFLDFVSSLNQAEPSVIADFVAVGARLTVLKSRSLLPRPATDDEEPEQSDLTYQLREYKRIKELASHLGQIHATGLVAHGPAAAIAPARDGQLAPLRSYDVTILVRTLRRRLTAVPRKPTLIQHRRAVSLRDVVDHVTFLVRRASPVRFSQVISAYTTRTEVATAFLAVLLLVRREAVDARQDDLFTDFQLTPGAANGASMDHAVDEFVN
jgi:segregation and condensation protein A